MRLSILICTLVGREEKLDRLLSCLRQQKTNDIEILVESDNGENSTGFKRNKLIERAKGDYICFIDDDDLVSSNYVSRILSSLSSDPDCVGFKVDKIDETSVTTMQLIKSLMTFKTGYFWSYVNDEIPTQLMIPDHLTPIKREYALKCKFKDISKAEDTFYSFEILKYLNTEIFIDEVLYYYMWENIPKKYEQVDSNPLISAIMITRDRFEFVKESIGYFEKQTYKNREMVIVCQGNDETQTDIEKYVSNKYNIRMIRAKSDVSKGDLINIGIEHSNGKYCIQWDDDDIHHEKRIEKQYLPIKNNIADFTLISNFIVEDDKYKKYINWDQGLDGTMLFPKSELRAPNINWHHDTEFCNLLRKKYRIANIKNNNYLYTYRIHSGQQYSKEYFMNDDYPGFKLFK